MVDEIKDKALNVILAMGSALKNIRLYPSNSVIVNDTTEKLYEAFLIFFDLYKSLGLSEADKKLLINGKPLSYKENERPQILTLLDILLKFSIKSITFNKGLERRELITLLEYFAANPEGVENAGDLSQMISGKKLSHVVLDERVFVARRKHQEILESLNITDDDIIPLLDQAHLDVLKNRQRLQAMAKNPEWLLESFDTGVSRLMEEKESLSNLQLSEKLTSMMTMMDKVFGQLDSGEQTKVLQGVEQSISKINPDVVREIMSQKEAENLFAGSLMKHITAELGELAPARAASIIADDSEEVQKNKNAAGKPVSDSDRDLHPEEKEEAPLTDGKKNILDNASIDDLLKIAEKLVTQKGQKEIETTIHRLLEDIFAEDDEVRNRAVGTLVEIIESLAGEKKIDFIEQISDKLLEWIKVQTSATNGYRKISRILQELVHHYIYQGNFVRAIPILDVFNNIRTGILKKDDAIHEASIEFIDSLSSKDDLDVLFHFFNTGEPRKRGKAGEIITMLGDDALNRLLDLLRNQKNSDERVRIMRMVIDSGKRAEAFVRDRINQNESWYYLRNMAYILGHIGNEDSAKALQPLLLHGNNKVRMEALKSIGRIGGKEMCPLLFTVMPQADNNFMLNMIDFLGSKKCTDAVASLINLFENNPINDKVLQADMEEKICNALGIIKSTEAVPFLSKIAESKSFLGRSRYAEKVRIAAGRALASITTRR